jgi:predicted PolB exonuclease-like 3'-5' exonuclease
MGLAGKPQGTDGAEVEKYYRDGRIKEIAQYCESKVINTYRVWLRYELFRGKLTTQSYEASEANLHKFLEGRSDAMSQAIKTIESDLMVR